MKKKSLKNLNKNGGNGQSQKPPEKGQSEKANLIRIPVSRTLKLYIGGAFPRTESGRFSIFSGKVSNINVCRASRKDFRNSVVAARSALTGWSGRTAYNRGQIIYRMGEMMEGRKFQFVEELINAGRNDEQAETEVNTCIDRIIYYAGWCDKYQQLFSSVNPVAAPYFNFSVPEPMGVVSAIAPNQPSLLGLISIILPVITGGNTCIILASEVNPVSAVSLAEVLHTSDLPGGVVNILTGLKTELVSYFSNHKDVNAIVYGADPDTLPKVKAWAAANVKRVIPVVQKDWYAEMAEGPYKILDTQEIKTTWHPVGK